MSALTDHDKRRACVIGAGLAGLALAIRLQAAGIATTLIDANKQPGGSARTWQHGDFTFGGGPGAILDPAGIEELWSLTGDSLAADVNLLAVSPFYRLNWPDGTGLDWPGDPAALTREIARIAPGDLGGCQEFADYAEAVCRDGFRRLAASPPLDPASAWRGLSGLARHQPWRSLHALASRMADNPRLRQALSFPVLAVGGNPLSASAAYAAIHALLREGGLWCVEGGTGQLVAAMARRFEALGGRLRLGDAAVRIHLLGNRASEVECASGWREHFDAVASCADPVHTYRALLSEDPRGTRVARRLTRRRFAPALFTVHFAIDGAWPGIAHHTVLFGPRYEGLLRDLFDHGVLPRDFIVHLHHPTVTDPSLAPEGKSVFSATIPVPNLGRLPVDWDRLGPELERRVLGEVGRRLIPDIHDRVIARFHVTPQDHARDYNHWQGTPFGLEPSRWQSAWLRCRSRDAKIANLFLAGTATLPGAGLPAVLASARTAAGLMIGDLM